MLDPNEVAFRRKSGDRIVNVSKESAAKLKEQTARWQRECTVALTVRFSRDKDADVLEKLAAVDNKTGYLRELIRRDIPDE